MAIESQGVEIRFDATAATSVKLIDATALSFTTTGGATACKILSDDTGVVNFEESSISSGMRIITNATALATQVWTVKTVSPATLELYEPVATSVDSTILTITGRKMYSIGEIVSFSGPAGSAAIIDITNLASTAKQKLPGLRDEGNVTIEVNLSGATAGVDHHQRLKDDFKTRRKCVFDIKLTNNLATSSTSLPTSLYYEGFITGFSISGAVDDVVKASITQEITSAIRWRDKVSS